MTFLHQTRTHIANSSLGQTNAGSHWSLMNLINESGAHRVKDIYRIHSQNCNLRRNMKIESVLCEWCMSACRSIDATTMKLNCIFHSIYFIFIVDANILGPLGASASTQCVCVPVGKQSATQSMQRHGAWAAAAAAVAALVAATTICKHSSA